jgi:hypothetical protein
MSARATTVDSGNLEARAVRVNPGGADWQSARSLAIGPQLGKLPHGGLAQVWQCNSVLTSLFGFSKWSEHS